MHSKLFIAAALLAAFGTQAFAQAPQGGAPQTPPTSVRGTIQKIDDQAIVVKNRDGSTTEVKLAPNYRISTLVRKKLSDIHAGDFVGATSVPGKDGKLHATEIHIFPAALRGAGEGQQPWDTQPNAVMTNATVTGVAKATQGQVLSVNYKGSTAQMIVDRHTVIVAPSPHPASVKDLARGKTVYVFARKGPDGALTTGNVTVEKNGVKPPM
ncbi:MAG TPA: hypothetical protein VG328_13205 [Stellaceae bacterium]|jgi:hypothetical protein|nr:hypothetical protein [Stellaceae bacterium]